VVTLTVLANHSPGDVKPTSKPPADIGGPSMPTLSDILYWPHLG